MSTGRIRRAGVAAAAVALLAGCTVVWAGEVVLAAKDFPIEVGSRATFSATTADGQPRGEVTTAVIGKRTAAKSGVFRQAVFFGPMRVQDGWLVQGDDEFAMYASFGAPQPAWKCPLPLRPGLRYEYESATGGVRARVEGPEEVTVPAGTFTCLVCVEERERRGERRTEKRWLAPRVGTVKVLMHTDQDYTLSLVRWEGPREGKPPAGADVVSTFDVGEPLGSPLFPKAVWNGISGQPGSVSLVEIDPSGGADGTPFCLRWTYHTRGTWVAASLAPSGDIGEPADLSRYGSVSFYIKGLAARGCSVSLQAKAAGRDERILVHIPIQVTTQWQKIVLSPKTHPQLEQIDPTQVTIFGLSDFAQDEAANVIWLDEVLFHTREAAGQF